MKPTYQQLEKEVKKLREQMAQSHLERLESETALLSLQESEEKYRDVFKSSVDSLTIARMEDGIIVEVNDGFTKNTGYTWEDIKGKSFKDLGIWENLNDRERIVKSLEIFGGVKNMEARFRIKDGRIVHGLISANFIQIQGKKHLFLLVRNIDEMKKVEDTLNQAQEIGKIGSWEMDWVSRKLIWSDQLYRIFELDKAKISPDVELFKILIHPEDLQQAVRVLRSSIRRKTQYQHQHRVLLKNEKIKWVVEMGRTFYDPKGKPLSSVGTVQDITDQKLAEDALRKSESLFQSLATISPVGIFRTDAEAKITYVNPTWCKLSGMASTDAMEDGWLKAVHPEDREKLMDSWKVNTKNIDVTVSEYRFLHPDGTVVYVKGQAVPELDSSDRVIGYVGTITDITKLILAKDALREGEENFRLLFEQSPLGIFTALPNGSVINANPKLLEIMGSPSLEATRGINIVSFPPLVKSGYSAHFKACTKSGKIHYLEVPYTSKWGKEIFLSSRIVPLKDGEGKVNKVYTVLEDITERKNAEKALQKAHGDLVDTLENMTDGFTSVDKNWRYLYVNKRAGEILGRVPQDLIGKNVWDEFPEMVNTSFYERSMEAIRNKDSVMFENYFAPKKQWFENRLVPTADGMSTFFLDITQRKQAEETLHEQSELLLSIARNYPNSIVSVLNRKNELELVSGKFLLDRGYDIARLQWQSLSKVLSEKGVQNNKEIEEMVSRAFSGEKMSREFSILGYDFMFYALPLYLHEGEVIKILAIAVDMSQVKKAERDLQNLNESLELKVSKRTAKLEKSEQAMIYLLEDMKETQVRLRKSNKQMQQLNTELESFSYSVSHDLKAPLRAISGFSGFLKEDYFPVLGEDGRHLLDDIIQNTSNMGQLIDGLLDLSRTGRKTLHRVAFDLKPLSQSIFSEQKKYFNLPNAKLEVLEGIPTLHADYTLFKQLMTNLISNALKYASKKPQALIKIGCKRDDNEQRIFFVEDNGVGFNTRYAKKMFDTFQRLHSKSEYEGTGIGLSIVQRIINKHGGKVWAEGELNKGATIFFTLPDET